MVVFNTVGTLVGMVQVFAYTPWVHYQNDAHFQVLIRDIGMSSGIWSHTNSKIVGGVTPPSKIYDGQEWESPQTFHYININGSTTVGWYSAIEYGTPFPFHHIWDGVNNGQFLHVAIDKDGSAILAGFSSADINGDFVYWKVGLLEL